MQLLGLQHIANYRYRGARVLARSVSGENFGHNQSRSKCFQDPLDICWHRPTGYMLTSFGFSLLDSVNYSKQIGSFFWSFEFEPVIFQTQPVTGSSIPSGWFSLFIVLDWTSLIAASSSSQLDRGPYVVNLLNWTPIFEWYIRFELWMDTKMTRVTTRLGFVQNIDIILVQSAIHLVGSMWSLNKKVNLRLWLCAPILRLWMWTLGGHSS